MRKIKFILIIFAGAITFGLASCNSMESDAKEVAKRGAAIDKIYKAHWKTGLTASDQKEVADYMQFADKMLEKYGKDPQSRDKFNALVAQEKNKLKEE